MSVGTETGTGLRDLRDDLHVTPGVRNVRDHNHTLQSSKYCTNCEKNITYLNTENNILALRIKIDYTLIVQMHLTIDYSLLLDIIFTNIKKHFYLQI